MTDARPLVSQQRPPFTPLVGDCQKDARLSYANGGLRELSSERPDPCRAGTETRNHIT